MQGVPSTKTWTITFGECVENHKGMEMIGDVADRGFSTSDLIKMKERIELFDPSISCELISFDDVLENQYKHILEDDKSDKKLETSASILIIRKGVSLFFTDNELSLFEQEVYETEDKVDKKAFMKGRVCNKKARWNLCYGNESQEPDYENKKGRVIAFSDVPLLGTIRQFLPAFFGKKSKNMLAELNFYYDTRKTYISPHGDSERKRVIAIRMGADFDLQYQWYLRSEPISNIWKTTLHHTDMYVMSEKAGGSDWLRSSIPTLRHAAYGCDYKSK